MDCLVFTDESKSLTAKKQIWYNYLLEQVNLNASRCLYTYEQLQGLSPEDTYTIVLFNFTNGMVDTEKGFTKCLVDYRQKYLSSEFYMQKPESQYMTNAVNFTEVAFDNNWVEPME